MSTVLHLQPITLKEAHVFVARHHRRHDAAQGGLWAIGVNDGQSVVGVAVVGRPVSRMLADGYTAEVTRLCVLDGHPNACSKLYAACWRAWRAMGGKRLVTYTLITEPGTSLRAAGWREMYTTQGGSWDRASRPRVDTAPICQKVLWEAAV